MPINAGIQEYFAIRTISLDALTDATTPYGRIRGRTPPANSTHIAARAIPIDTMVKATTTDAANASVNATNA
jgi:hypothetical protein